jgi:hypothetical protein
LRWGRANALPGSGDARGGRATLAYPSANEGCHGDLYGCRVADTWCHTAGNPDGDAIPCAPFAYPHTLADGHDNEHADAPAAANAGSHTNAGPHVHPNLTSDDL